MNFLDHFEYEIEDLQFEDSNPIITTEKDAVKFYRCSSRIQTFSVKFGLFLLMQCCHQHVMNIASAAEMLGIQFDEGLN